MSDAINPMHYKSHPSGVECIEIRRHLKSNRADAIKYLWRCGKKDAANQELKKAIWYLHDEINENCGYVDYKLDAANKLGEKIDALAVYESQVFFNLLQMIVFGSKDNLLLAIKIIEGMCDD